MQKKQEKQQFSDLLWFPMISYNFPMMSCDFPMISYDFPMISWSEYSENCEYSGHAHFPDYSLNFDYPENSKQTQAPEWGGNRRVNLCDVCHFWVTYMEKVFK